LKDVEHEGQRVMKLMPPLLQGALNQTR
jgi:hypothetical protein